MKPHPSDRALDVVAFGVSGFVGLFVVKCLLKTHPQGGRQVPELWDRIKCAAKVVFSIAGPSFRQEGELVASCDLTGETQIQS